MVIMGNMEKLRQRESLRSGWGKSMETEFHQGDIIVINSYLQPEHNDYVVVSNEEGR